MMYLFVWYTFGTVYMDNFINKLGQTSYSFDFKKIL
jgi:hypothetical protein